jgi:uncharacterized repeat protein (TIGR01451 family)
MRPVVHRLCLLLRAASLWLLCGCFGVSQNPSYFPYLLPTGDIIRTHAKPPGHGYYANFDPRAVRLEVRSLDATNPVRTQHVIIATVYDANGLPRRDRRVEWMLEGVGQIVEVDESGCAPGRGYKVDNRYAVSYTNYREHRITRGTADPNDDFVLRPGQTWCVVSSATEGDTYVTAYAPGINNWDNQKVVVTAHWVDAEWAFPPPATVRAGTESVLTTYIFKHTDKHPLANYRVRYHIIDGPPAVFLPYRTQTAEVISDLSGNAMVTLAQVQPQVGVNRIGIEVIRPPDPTSPSASGIVIGRGETFREWLAPQITLNHTGPPTATVGQEVTYTITVANTGKIDVQPMTVRNPITPGLQVVRSQPTAVQDNNQLVWTLGELRPGQQHVLQAVFRTTQVGVLTNCANVVTADGIRDERCVTTQVTTPQLQLSLNAPATGTVGVPVTYQVTLTNTGGSPATGIVLSAAFDAGLQFNSPEGGGSPLTMSITGLGPGETRTLPFVLTPRQVGRWNVRVSTTADGNLRAEAAHTITVQQAQVTITKVGPAVRYVDRPITWDVVVTNAGDAPLTNVVVRDRLPNEVAFVSATEGGQVTAGEVAWNLGTLPPRERKVLQVTGRCLAATARTVNVATVTSDAGTQQAEAALEIRGVPAYRLEVGDTTDPVQVGGRTSYRILVTNQGSLPGNGVEITAIVPKELRVVNANGPSQSRVDGQRITFLPMNNVAPKTTLTYEVDVEAREPGDVRFHVELRAQGLQEPVVEEESTNIVAPGQGGRPPAAPAPAPGAVPAAPGSGPPAGAPPIPPPPASVPSPPASLSRPGSPLPPGPPD